MEPSSAILGALLSAATGAAIAVWLTRASARTRIDAELGAARAERQQELTQAMSDRARAEALAQARDHDLAVLRSQSEQLRAELEGVRAEAAALSERVRRLPELEAQAAHTQTRIDTLGTALTQARIDAESLKQQLQAEQDRLVERQQFIDRAHETLSVQFKAVAADILATNSTRFTEQNRSQLDQVLGPLRERLGDFQKKVETLYFDEGKERSALREQVQQLVSLNQTLRQEARELTSALRGSSKTMGNWGELILERVLESSGLRKGHEYLVQDSQTNEDGQRRQPDVVIHLPESRRLVVDSKLSLLAYERFMSSEVETEREAALREHLNSVRTHIRQLADKRYQRLYGESLDFVLMFVPIEPAFMTAVTHDERLFSDAWDSNVLLVSPSTLLFVVRTVAHLWRQESQSRNAQEIARRGAELHDRLSGFLQSMHEVGVKMDAAQSAHREAVKKLSSGRGNVIRQAQMLRELGVKPGKSLPQPFLEAAEIAADSAETGMARVEADDDGATPPTPPHASASFD